MREALDQADQEPEPEVIDTPEPTPEAVVERSEDFDAEALADLAADAVRRMVRPEDRPGDLLLQALSGGAVGEEAMYQLRQKYRRAGWHYSIDPRTGTRTPRR